MGVENKFALAQATSYFVALVLSFFICIPSGINVDQFDGHCLLSPFGTWEAYISPPRIVLNIVEWGPSSACNFTIFIGVLSMILALFYCGWTSSLLARGIQSSWLDAFSNLIVNIMMCVCLFSTALTVSIGFNDWCNLLTRNPGTVDKCEDGQYEDLTILHDDVHFQGSLGHYYTHWKMVQFGLWCSWIVWLILSVMSLVRQYNYHQQEATFTSINRERQRLLQRVGHSPESI